MTYILLALHTQALNLIHKLGTILIAALIIFCYQSSHGSEQVHRFAGRLYVSLTCDTILSTQINRLLRL